MYSFSLYRDFRDLFLANSTNGQKYIDWYYQISTHLNGFIYDPSVLLEILDLLDDLNEAILMIMNPTNYGSEILISSTFESRLLDLIDSFREFSTDTDYFDLLDDIEDELLDISGLTVNQVISLKNL